MADCKILFVFITTVNLVASAVPGISVSDLEQRITVLESNMADYKAEAQKQASSLLTELSKATKDRQRLEQTISQLQTQIQSQEQHYQGVVAGLLSKATLTEDKLVNLTKVNDRMASLYDKLSNLSTTCSTLQVDVKSLQEKEKQNHASILRLSTSSAQAMTQRHDQTKNVSDLQKVVDALQTSRNKVAAFTSFLHGPVTVSPPYNVVFNDIYMNIGNHYNSSNGIFTCSYSGVYVFHLHAKGFEGGKYRLYIYRGTDPFYGTLGVYSGDVSGGFNDGSNTILLHLRVGEEVMVKAAIHSNLDLEFTTFSGFLLYAD